MSVTFAELLAAYPRIAIAGGPRLGKTTLSRRATDRRIVSTDDYMALPWSDVPERLIAETSKLPAFVLEGVQVGRALRKGLKVDAVVILKDPKVQRTPAQVSMTKGIDKVIDEWRSAHPEVPVYIEARSNEATELQFEGPPLPEVRADSRLTLVVRYDRQGTLDSDLFERTPQGGIRAPARFTRIGVLEYELPDGSVRREYRPPDEVFRRDSLQTLVDAPVTHLHPRAGKVDAETYAELSKGHVSTDVGVDEDTYVAGTVVVQDAEVVRLVETRDLCEFSAGYVARLDMTPGVSPEGEPYDCIQRDIKYNHVALLPRGQGRAGPDVSLRLDSNGHQMPTENTTMELTPEEIAALKALAEVAPKLLEAKADNSDEPEKKVDNESEKPKSDEGDDKPKADNDDPAAALSPETVEALKSLAAAAPALLKLVKPAEEAAQTAPSLDSDEQERLITDSIELRDKAREVLGKTYSFRGKSNRQVREDVIRHVDSKFALKGKSDEAVAALFDMALARHAERLDSASNLSSVQPLARVDSADREDGTVSSFLAKSIAAAGKR